MRRTLVYQKLFHVQWYEIEVCGTEQYSECFDPRSLTSTTLARKSLSVSNTRNCELYKRVRNHVEIELSLQSSRFNHKTLYVGIAAWVV